MGIYSTISMSVLLTAHTLFVMKHSTNHNSYFVCVANFFSDIIVATVGALIILLILVFAVLIICLIVIKRPKNCPCKYSCYVLHVYSWYMQFKLYLLYCCSQTGIHKFQI